MAVKATCPQLADFLEENECLENIAGLGTDVYLGLRSELESEMKATDNVYATPTFKSGKGLYKVQCKDDSQQIQSSSSGQRNGFELTCNFVIDSVNKESSKLSRAINNNDIFIIVKDREDSQILYDPQHKVKFESGAIKSGTGAKSGDDRTTSYEAKLSNVLYPNLYVTAPEGGWDSLLASANPA